MTVSNFTDKKVNPLDAYSTCIGMRLHFDVDSSYDGFKFQFKGPRVTAKGLMNRKDRFHYEKIAKNYPTKTKLIEFFLANYLEGNHWVGDMTDDVHLKWTGKIQRLDYQFQADMKIFYEACKENGISFNDALSFNAGESMPLILFMLKREMISLESVAMLNCLVNFTPKLLKDVVDPLGNLKGFIYKIQQYSRFISKHINKSIARQFVIKLFTSDN